MPSHRYGARLFPTGARPAGGKPKLTDDDVRVIRRLGAMVLGCRVDQVLNEVQRRWGLSRVYARQVMDGGTHRHVM